MKQLMKSVSRIGVLVILCLLPCVAFSQRGTTPKTLPPKKPFDKATNILQRQVDALGSRTQTPGKEQTTYVGEFTYSLTGVRSLVQVTYQTPGLVRLEGFNRPGVVSFDGTRVTGALNALDDQLLETFLMDTPEGMLSAVEAGRAVRNLGGGFSPSNAPRNYSGPRSDIYEIFGPAVSGPKQLLRQKLFFFDTATGLLQRTKYEDRSVPRPAKVEVRFSQWKQTDGSLYPGRLDRYEDGQLVFSFTVTGITSGPATDASRFR
jgi:hypothetical protein